MEISVKIKKADVYDEVAKLTSYTGAKNATPALYEVLFTTDDDRELLEGFWREGIHQVEYIATKWNGTVTLPAIAQQVDINEVLTLTLNMPSNFSTDTTPVVESALRSFMIHYITYKWFIITNIESSELYKAIAVEDMATANKLLNTRILKLS